MADASKTIADATEIASGYLILGLLDGNGNPQPPKSFLVSNLPENFTPTADNLWTVLASVFSGLSEDASGKTITFDKDALYPILKTALLGNRAEDDTAKTLTIPNTISEVTELANPGVSQTWTDISSDTYEDTDWVWVQLIEEAANYDAISIGPIKFGDIPSSNYIQKYQIAGAPIVKDNTVTAIPDENDSTDYKDLVTDAVSGDFYAIQARETAGNRRGANWIGLFEELPTSEGSAVWLVVGTGGGRFQVWRDGTNVRINRAGTVNSSNTASIFQYGTYQYLRIRKSGQKIRYRLHGDVATTAKLRVYKAG